MEKMNGFISVTRLLRCVVVLDNLSKCQHLSDECCMGKSDLIKHETAFAAHYKSII